TQLGARFQRQDEDGSRLPREHAGRRAVQRSGRLRRNKTSSVCPRKRRCLLPLAKKLPQPRKRDGQRSKLLRRKRPKQFRQRTRTPEMALVLGFDVYGTLVDPFGMERQLESLFGDRGNAICALWRQKQLEYSFRRGLMRCYEDFDACTERALSFAVKTLKVEL